VRRAETSKKQPNTGSNLLTQNPVAEQMEVSIRTGDSRRKGK